MIGGYLHKNNDGTIGGSFSDDGCGCCSNSIDTKEGVRYGMMDNILNAMRAGYTWGIELQAAFDDAKFEFNKELGELVE